MTSPHIRVRRLFRLAARARADVVAAERRLAQAAREAAAAADRAATLATILADTRPSIGTGSEDALLAGAHLRQVLAPAMAAATGAERAAALGEAEAGRRLAEATARADGLDDRLADLRRAARGAAEQRNADLLPVGRSRR